MGSVTGTVKYSAGKVFNGQYGPSINIVVKCHDKEIRVYGTPGDAANPLESLQRDQAVVLEQNAKGQWQVNWQETKAQPAPDQSQRLPDSTARIMKAATGNDDAFWENVKLSSENLVKVYKDVYRMLSEVPEEEQPLFPDENTPAPKSIIRDEDLAAATATVFIQLFRKL